MRSYEFITETITIANYQDQFEETIEKAILDSLNLTLKLASKHRPFDELFKSIEPLSNRYMDKFLFYLTSNCRINFSMLLESFVAQRYENDAAVVSNYRSVGNKITFRSDVKPNVNGYVNQLSIVINSDLLNSINSAIKQYIYDYFHNADIDQQLSIKDNFLKIIQKIIDDPKSFFKKYLKLRNVIIKLVETVTHELVHVFQNTEQLRKKRTNIEYRSYLEKDPKKFQTAMKRKASIEDFRIYHASPQEINAFAHNITSQILKNTDMKSLILWSDMVDQSKYNKIISDYVAAHLQYTLEQRKNMTYIEQKVFKRYVKQVYQILQHYIETEQEKVYNKLSNYNL